MDVPFCSCFPKLDIGSKTWGKTRDYCCASLTAREILELLRLEFVRIRGV